MENAHLIVGLGNPGAEYAQTRHNAGFLVVERLVGRWRAAWTNEKKFQARIARAQHIGQRVFLTEPQTFMNSSGEAVAAVIAFYRVPLAKLLVVVDDDVDVQNENAVWSSVAAHADPARDLILWDGPADPLDHATEIRGVGRKGGSLSK